MKNQRARGDFDFDSIYINIQNTSEQKLYIQGHHICWQVMIKALPNLKLTCNDNVINGFIILWIV